MHTSRRRFVSASLGLIAAQSLPAWAAAKPLRIYMVTFRGESDVEKGFRNYFASRKIPVEFIARDINRDATKLPGLRQEIRQLKPDLIFTWGTTVTLGIVGPHDKPNPAEFINDIPTVFSLVAAPVLAKIAPSLTSSQRNLTGVYHVASVEAQIRAMDSYRPCKKLGVLYSPTETNSVVTIKELETLSKRGDFKLFAQPFKKDEAGKLSANGVEDFLQSFKAEGVDWLYLPPESFLGTIVKETVVPLAHGLGIPTFASTEQLFDGGALAGLFSHYRDIGEFTGYKAAQILTENKAARDIPIETLARYAFVIRMSAARLLGTFPPLQMFNYAEFIEN